MDEDPIEQPRPGTDRPADPDVAEDQAGQADIGGEGAPSPTDPANIPDEGDTEKPTRV